MNQRKVRSIQSKLARLARNDCASYKDGACELQRCGQCIVAIETETLPGNVCGYFMKSVLPAKPALMNEYLSYFPRVSTIQKANVKNCSRCCDPFEAKGNRAKYCDHCKTIAKREQTVASNRRLNSGK